MIPALSADAAARVRALAPDERHLFVDNAGEGEYRMSLRHAKAYQLAAQYAHSRRVLDLGCGSGSGAVHLARTAAVTAVDADERLIAMLPSLWPGTPVRWTHSGRGRLPLEDGSFDLVTSFQVIEHVTDMPQYLAEVRRVLRPDGLFLCTTPNRLLRVAPFQRPWNPYHVRELTSWQLRRALVQAGFCDVALLGLSGTRVMTRPERIRTLKMMAGPLIARMPQRLRAVVGRRTTGHESSDPPIAGNAATPRDGLEAYWWSPRRLFLALDLMAIARR